MKFNFFDGASENANWIGGFFVLLGIFGLFFQTPEGIYEGSLDDGFLAFIYVLFKPFGIIKTSVFFMSIGAIIILFKNRKIFIKK